MKPNIVPTFQSEFAKFVGKVSITDPEHAAAIAGMTKNGLVSPSPAGRLVITAFNDCAPGLTDEDSAPLRQAYIDLMLWMAEYSPRLRSLVADREKIDGSLLFQMATPEGVMFRDEGHNRHLANYDWI